MATDESSESATALWRRRKILLVLRGPLGLGLVLLVFMTLMYVQHVFSLMPMYTSGQMASRPDAEEAFVSSLRQSAIHGTATCLWLVVWFWHRRGLRRTDWLAAALSRSTEG